MARYGTRPYASTSPPGFKYGESLSQTYSVAPFTALALDHSRVYLSFAAPKSGYTKFRLLRNQDAIPDNEEDGQILLNLEGDDRSQVNSFASSGYIDGTYGNNIPSLISNKYVFYTIWLFINDNSFKGWLPVGYASTLVAQNVGRSLLTGQVTLDETISTDRSETTLDRLINMLSRTYFTETGSPNDAVDTSSTLYAFLDAFAYTLDEIQTLADFVTPNINQTDMVSPMSFVKTIELGISPEVRTSNRHQRALIRESNYIFSRKGTLKALSTLVESMTGYAPIITPSPNLMLSVQDSTFIGHQIGNWYGTGATIASDPYTVPPTAETLSYDKAYTAKVVPIKAGGKVSNGSNAPKTKGIPVSGGKSYKFSYYQKLNSTATITSTPTINWYDGQGTLISSATATPVSVTTSWAKASVTAVAPGGYADIVSASSVASTGVVTLVLSDKTDMSMFTTSAPYNTITVTAGKFGAANTTYTITSVNTGTKTIQYIYSSATDISSTSTSGRVYATNQSVYASVEVPFSAALSSNYVSLDLVQFSDSTVTDFYEARGVTVYVAPSKINHLPNPKLATNTGWTTSGTNGSSETIKLLKSVSEDSTKIGELTSGESFTFSVYALSDKFLSGATTVNAYIRVLDGSTEVAVGTKSMVNACLLSKPLLDSSTGWTVNNATPSAISTSPLPSGVGMGSTYTKLAQTSGNPEIYTVTDYLATPGNTYTFSIYAKSGDGSAKTGTLFISAYDGTASTPVRLATASKPISIPTNWTAGGSSDGPFTVTVTVPNDYTGTNSKVRIAAGITGYSGANLLVAAANLVDANPTSAALSLTSTRFETTVAIPLTLEAPTIEVSVAGKFNGETLTFSQAQLEESARATDYFDGSTLTDSGETSWYGTADSSKSMTYHSRGYVLSRLQNDIEEFLPMNTPYRIEVASSTDAGRFVDWGIA